MVGDMALKELFNNGPCPYTRDLYVEGDEVVGIGIMGDGRVWR